jgi:hypothetical protein
MAIDQEFTPRPSPVRDGNAPTVDMNFYGVNASLKALSNKLKEYIAGSSAALAAAGQFIKINLSQVTPQADAAYNINQYGIASQGHMHKMTISKNLTIPSDYCNQMVTPVVESGILVTVEAGGLWFVDT